MLSVSPCARHYSFRKYPDSKGFPLMGMGKVYLFHPTINIDVREVDFGEIGS